VSGELPAYISAPAKMELPHAGELIEAFFKPKENRTSRAGFHKEVYLIRGRGELRSPAGVQRTPLRISNI